MAYDLELQRFEEHVERPATPTDKVGLKLREHPMPVSQLAEETGLDLLTVHRVLDGRNAGAFAIHGELVTLQDPDIPDWYRSLLAGRTR